MSSRVQEDNVIDNKKVVLKEELLKILPKTGDASIAVGYFFISGLSAIIQPLQDVDKVRLLISNTTDKNTAEALIEGFHSIKEICTEVDKKNFVNDERKTTVLDDSKENIQKSLEHMSQTTADKTVVEILIEMMKSKQLEVRVYPKEKLHAKAYIFQPKDKGFAQGMGIVGSSNLSLAGISHNSELNLKTYNPPDVNQLLDWFDELWKDGLEFTEDFDLILSNSWAGKTYSPYELFLKATYLEYKDKLEGQHEIDPIWGSTFPKLFPFQKNAVDQGLTMFELYGGVIIGDVVGLGKTYVGTALLKYLQLQEYRPLIICPPALIPMWEKFCADYEVDAKILSRGKLSQDNFELYQDYRYKDRDLVLIDESHHFRHHLSRQYENLHQFMQARDAKAILLTATPFSNDATDIKNQIMLFHQSPKTFIPPANETDLDRYFREIKKDAPKLVELLRNIMVRRTRRYVLNQWGKEDESGRSYLQVGDEHKYFPKRRMETERYDINKVYQRKYEKIVGLIDKESLTFARYSVGLYVKNKYKDIQIYKDLGIAGTKLVGLIRTLLLKRMESSLEAFKQSIRHYINSHKIFLKLLDEGIIPIGDVSYKAMYDIAKDDPDSINDPETIEEFRKKIKDAGETQYKFDAFNIDKLISDIQNDVETFETIDGLIHRLTWKTDDKLQSLQKLLDKDYSGKKVLIFTEFATTAVYLDDYLKWKGKKQQVDSATGNSIQCARLFDPENNPSNDPRPKKSEEISLLITTDVLAEGVNLQAGQVIINYDFHWNPTRLIQRAGRVDRIGSKNEFVTVHNFLLDPEMEEDLHLEYSVDNKINNIQKIIGEDYKILKEDEQINTEDIYAIYNGDDSILEREEVNPFEPSKFEKLLRDIQVNQPQLWEDFKKIPDGIRSSGNVKSGGKLLMACESGTEKSGSVRKYYLINSKEEITEIHSQKALGLLESSDEAVYSTPKNYDKLVSAGWKKFVEDTEQIRARASSVRLSISQKWIIEKLLKLDKDKKFEEQKAEIETLRKAFSIPILKGKLNRELLKIKKSEMNDSELIKTLSELYLHYELQNQLKQNEEESRSPRILYSKFVGD
jgi:superfamily II DNA or RNA helicase